MVFYSFNKEVNCDKRKLLIGAHRHTAQNNTMQAVGQQETGKKRKIARSALEREAAAAGAATAPKLPRNKAEAAAGRRVIVILERACFETVKTKKGMFELLNCDDHRHLHAKFKKNPSDSRPDIAHQALLALLDSPLNKAGLLQVYLHTEKNVLVEIHPSIRIPRTLKRFSGLIVQLLHKLKIRASDSPHTLMKVIKNPIVAHLPVGCRK